MIQPHTESHVPRFIHTYKQCTVELSSKYVRGNDWFTNRFPEHLTALQLCLLILSVMNVSCVWTASLRVVLDSAPNCIQSHLLHHQVEGKSTALTLNTTCWLSLCHSSTNTAVFYLKLLFFFFLFFQAGNDLHAVISIKLQKVLVICMKENIVYKFEMLEWDVAQKDSTVLLRSAETTEWFLRTGYALGH